jgi:hypothetical protein
MEFPSFSWRSSWREVTLASSVLPMIRIIDVRTAFFSGALICLFQDLYRFDVRCGTTYFAGAATVAFEGIDNGIGFIRFFVPNDFNCIERASIHTGIAIRNAE